MESVPEHLVVFLQNVHFLVAVVNVLKQIGVRLLSSKETFHQFLNVSDASSSFYIFECSVDLGRISHFFFHFFPHERVPELLNIKVLAVLYFGLVLAVVGSLFGNFLFFLYSLHPLLDRLLFVFQALGDLRQNRVRVCVLFFDILHQSVNSIF